MKIYFFGIGFGDANGHFLHDAEGRKVWSSASERELPFRYTLLDGGLLPPNNNGEHGRIYRSEINGWTVITMADFSALDKRPGCNASFVVEGVFSIPEMVEICSQKFPQLWERIKPTHKPTL